MYVTILVNIASYISPSPQLDFTVYVHYGYMRGHQYRGYKVCFPNILPLVSAEVVAYQVFANYGTYFAPTSILEIHNSQGKILERFSREKNYQNEIVGKIETALVSKILTDEKSRPETLTGNEENPEETFAWNRYLQIGNFS